MADIWIQKEIRLGPYARGFHLITEEILAAVPELAQIHVGLAHLFLLHTSASLTLNENADPTVRRDMEAYFRHAVPEDAPYFVHTYEGPDDMPAHVKTSLLGSSLIVPVRAGRFVLGTWQGIYLGEHRQRGRPRRLVVTAFGRPRDR